MKLRHSIVSTLRSFFYPQVLLLTFLPLLISLVVVVLGIWISWDFWMSLFESGPLAYQPYWFWLLGHSPEWLHPVLHFFSAVAPWVLLFGLFAMSYPIVIGLNLVFVSILASTYLVKFIAARSYGDLQAQGRPRLLEGLMNTISSVGLFLLYWFLTLPLWLIPGAALVLPFLLTAWLNRRICSFDTLTDFATDEEMKRVRSENSEVGFVVGLLAAAVNFLPMAFFISPVVTMLGFIHLNLESLRQLRAKAR